MKVKGSKIAYGIDMDFRKTDIYKEISMFKEKYCNHCINANTKLCEIRRTIDKKLKCVYFTREEKK